MCPRGREGPALPMLLRHYVGLRSFELWSRQFAEHDGPAGAGDTRQISRQAVHGAVGEHGEGDGFFGVHRKAIPVGKFDGETRQGRLAGRPAADDCGRRRPRRSSRFRRVRADTNRSSASAIVATVSSAAVRSKSVAGARRLREIPLHEFSTELFASGALGWLATKERQTKHPSPAAAQSLCHATASRPPAS